MARPDKAAAVAALSERFSDSTGVVLTEYRGLTVKALGELRRSLGDDATYAVSKNTLTTIAARNAGVDGVEDLLVGPTAIAFIKGDAVNVAKGLRDFGRANPLLVIKGGVLDGKVLTPAEVGRLADLESREVLLAKVAGGMQGILQQAISLIAAPLAQVARLAAALQQAAEENPSLLAPAVATEAQPEPTDAEPAVAEDTSEPSNDELAAEDTTSEPSNDELAAEDTTSEPSDSQELAASAATAAPAAPSTVDDAEDTPSAADDQ